MLNLSVLIALLNPDFSRSEWRRRLESLIAPPMTGNPRSLKTRPRYVTN